MLNKPLFNALERMFGRGKVKVRHADEKMDYDYQEVYNEDGQRRLRLHRKKSGQEFQVRCPICHDYKPRLSISYKWGVSDERSGSLNLWLIQCWNENCFSDFQVRRNFFAQVFDGSTVVNDDDTPEYASDETLVRKGKPKMPGRLWRLDKLAVKSPHHAAVLYAQNRLLNIQELGETFGVGFCPDPEFRAAENRIVAPVFCQGKFCGWTGRYISSPRPKAIPKWFHDPNMDKAELLYNYDQASQHHTKFLVEGPGDVWGLGVRGMAVLGKTISDSQLSLLSSCCGADSALVLMFDPTQNEKDAARGQKHHMEKAYAQLASVAKLQGKLVKVYVSDKLDPGDADRGYLFKLALQQARQARVKLRLPEVL